MADTIGSNLPLISSFATGDKIPIIRVSDTTTAPAGAGGSNKVMLVSQLSDMIDTAIGSTQGNILYRGASAWSVLAPGTAGQRLESGGPGANPVWSAPTAVTAAYSIVGVGDQVINTTTETSLFTGATGTGSLTIPANRLVVGSAIRPTLWGSIGTTASSPTITIRLKIGGTVLAFGLSGTMATSVTGKLWFLDRGLFSVVTIGATGTIRGYASWVATNTASVGVGSCYLTTGGAGDASTPVTIDTTGTLDIDLTAQWSAANSSNAIRLLGGAIWIDG